MKSPRVSWEKRVTANLKQKNKVRFWVMGFRKKDNFLAGHVLEKQSLKLQAATSVSGTENSKHHACRWSAELTAPSPWAAGWERRRAVPWVGERAKGSSKLLTDAFQMAPLSSAPTPPPNASVWEASERPGQQASKCVHRHL